MASAFPAPPVASFPPPPHTAPSRSINLPPTPAHLRQYHQLPSMPIHQHAGMIIGRDVGLPPGMQAERRGSGGLGLMGHTESFSQQLPDRPPVHFPPPLPLGQVVGQMPPHPSLVPRSGPRPHPHLSGPDLYISNVPHDLPEVTIVDALRDCLPVRIKLNMPVNQGDRLKPDAYYDWMPRAGTLHFTNLHSAEKALAILIEHPYLAQAGLIVSASPPPSSPFDLPHILPFPNPPVPARYLRPTQQIIPSPCVDVKDAAAALSAQVPSLGELFDIIRPWGSLRQITVWFEEGAPTEFGPPALSWGARVVFWYDDEARRFEYGFGATGLLIKGWQIFIFADQIMPFTPPLSLDPPLAPQSQIVPRLLSALSNPFLHPGLNGPNSSNVDPEIFRRMGMPLFPPPPIPPNFDLGPQHQAPPTPLTPSNTFRPVPWANHNIFADSAKLPPSRRQSVPTGPNALQLGLRRSMGNIKLDQTPEGHARQRTWSITLSNPLEGDVFPVGVVADDGTFIHHGRGQNLRPAPQSGPGSESSSGLVDYSNLFVKNLDPDINSMFLSDLFSNIGTIVSAKVMRDDQGRSRGYGFVSFHSPNEAVHAIAVMNNTRVGSQNISVNLHQPKKLRPEKAQRSQDGTSVPAVVKPPPSPTTMVRRDKHVSAPAQSSWTTGTSEDLQLLSPEARRLALVRRITVAVFNYARIHRIPDRYTEPAIRALAADDLAIVPLLDDAQHLEQKIAATIRTLQEDPAYPSAVLAAVSKPPASPVGAAELRSKLVIEVTKIDPEDAGAVVDILWLQLQPADRVRAIHHRGFLAMRYGLAKRQLMRQRTTDQPSSADKASETSSATSSADPSPPASLATSTTSHAADPSLPLQIDYIRLEEVTLDKLAARSAYDIMAHLSCPLGNEVLERLGMSRPTSDEAGQLARWIMAVREKPVLQRDAEIGAIVAKQFQVSWLARSGVESQELTGQTNWAKRLFQLKVAREMVEKEDIGSLCKLIAYPKLLDAKARLYHETMNA